MKTSKACADKSMFDILNYIVLVYERNNMFDT